MTCLKFFLLAFILSLFLAKATTELSPTYFIWNTNYNFTKNSAYQPNLQKTPVADLEENFRGNLKFFFNLMDRYYTGARIFIWGRKFGRSIVNFGPL